MDLFRASVVALLASLWTVPVVQAQGIFPQTGYFPTTSNATGPTFAVDPSTGDTFYLAGATLGNILPTN